MVETTDDRADRLYCKLIQEPSTIVCRSAETPDHPLIHQQYGNNT